jgi:hypothetical protein
MDVGRKRDCHSALAGRRAPTRAIRAQEKELRAALARAPAL